MSRPRLLDLFAGAGGAARGYQQAGFHVTGVDIVDQPRYAGDEFHQADAMTWPLDGYDAIHASPPCQAYTTGGRAAKDGRHPDLLPTIRQRLATTGTPYVIENVPGAPMRADIILCGSMFGLPVRRHRWFETNIGLPPWTLGCNHSQPVTGVYGHPHGDAGAWPGMLPSTLATWSTAMGIEWMTVAELTNAIPPAYTEWIGHQLLAVVLPVCR